MKTKICTKCGKRKPKRYFNIDKSKQDGRYSSCKTCVNEYCKRHYRERNKNQRRKGDRQYYRRNREQIRKRVKRRWAQLSKKQRYLRGRRESLRQYGLTLEQYNDLLIKQNSRCAICKRHRSSFKKALSVDHDHKTGNVRGLLCVDCNIKLGVLENRSFIKLAKVYLAARLR